MKVLAVNCGASSLRSAVVEPGGSERVHARACFEGIGLSIGSARLVDGLGRELFASSESLPSHEVAARRLIDALHAHGMDAQLDVVGHRIVNGHPDLDGHRLLDEDMLHRLEEISVSDPVQAQRYIRVVRVLRECYPEAAAVGCLDSAIHMAMPERARRYAIARELHEKGIRRYGMHGLSSESVLGLLARQCGEHEAHRRIVVAHLGCSASMNAFSGGQCVECTTGFAPGSGLMSATRSGDVAPSIVLHLMASMNLSAQEAGNVMQAQSGLLGVSRVSREMRDLLKLSETHADANEAVSLFSYIARKHLGSMIAALGGIDTLVFTGGIGVHAARVRREICDDMEYAGLRLDQALNRRGEALVSTQGSPASIRIIPCDEELMIARIAARIGVPATAR